MLKKYKVKVNGNEYEVEVEEIRENQIETISKAQEKLAAKPAVKRNASKEVIGSNVIKASLPGTILKINVKEGDSVKSGDVIIVLESMKMETPVSVSVDGVVASINVEEGASVSAGDVLASIK